MVERTIAELCVLDVEDGGFVLVEFAPGVEREQVERETEAPIRRFADSD